MRQFQIALKKPPVIIDEVEIECAGSVPYAPHPAEFGLHLMQEAQQILRRKRRFDLRDRVHERRIGRSRPSLAYVEARHLRNLDPAFCQGGQRGADGFARRPRRRVKISAKRNQDHGPFPPRAAGVERPHWARVHLQKRYFMEAIMLFYPQERIAIFVDGANLYGAAKGLQFDIDYKRLLELFARKGVLVRAFYYTALAEDQEFSPLRPLIDWLDYNGFAVVTKPLKEYTDAQGRRRVKGNMDIELAIDVMEMSERVDHIVIFSGDGDFRKLVEAVQRKGRRVSVVSTVRTQPPMVSDELRRQADNFIELEELKPMIAREGGGRQQGVSHTPANFENA